MRFPGQLLSRARVLAGEYAWPPSSARAAIDWLRSEGFAVVGVEEWTEEDNQPRWIASSNYECPDGSNWAQYVECCAQGAKAFVTRFENEPGAIFNLSWVAPEDGSGRFAG